MIISPFGEAFHFTHEDIRANRQRQLSWRQRRRLWGLFWLTLIGGLLLVMMPILVAWSLIWWATDQPFAAAMGDSRAGIGYLVGGLLGGMYFLANFKTLLLAVDLLGRRVRVLKGVAQIWGQYLLIGRHRFVIGEEAVGMLQSGLSYRVFILPASNTLLSIEFAE